MMIKKKLVSVLMPAFNAENYISEAIESILKQTYTDFEFIIIDDASTDKTWPIIQSYLRKDHRIKAYRNKQNLYIAGNRNILIGLAKGKYIAWQDADDISYPNRIKHQLEFMEEKSNVGIVGGYLEYFNENGIKSIRKYAPDDNTLRKYIFMFSPVAQPGAMLRKQCFIDLGMFDLRFPPAEDIEMSFRIGTKYQFANLEEIVIKYRENHTSATYSRLRKIELSTIEARIKYFTHSSYHATLIDIIYNLLQFISIFIIPPKLKIWCFSKFRNTNII
jgi:glycosyltransferase involved in cell wall biosynthesis